MPSVHAVVMAGGRGERFWPLSTDRLSKPFIPLLGSRTLIQDTVDRLQGLVPPERVFISIGEAHLEVARNQLPGIPAANFIVEPVGRDTSACIGWCALHVEQRDAQGALLAIPADHFVGDAEAYRRTLRKGFDSLTGSSGVVFGVRPVRPETGYGYVQVEKPGAADVACRVLRFVEKPDAAVAVEYLRSGDYFWNSGIFLWENTTLLELFARHLPDTYRGLEKLRAFAGRPGADPAELLAVFSALPRISIDFGILEKTSGLRLLPVEFDWDDIGNWHALERALPADVRGNISRGNHVSVNSTGCIVLSDSGTIATFGVSDLVVVQAHGNVLVCPKDRASDLKRLVTALGPEKK